MPTIDFKQQAEALRRTEEEIRKEIADSFGRSGRALEKAIAELRAVRERLLSAASCEERAAFRVEFEAVRRRVDHRRWCLIVQRECLGLRDHRDLDRAYPIPDLPE